MLFRSAGGTVTFIWHLICGLSGPNKQPSDPGCPIHTIDWDSTISNLPGGATKVSSCTQMNLACTVRISDKANTTRYFGAFGTFVWDGGGCTCGEVPMAIVAKGAPLLMGRIVNKEGQPVTGLRVNA